MTLTLPLTGGRRETMMSRQGWRGKEAGGKQQQQPTDDAADADADADDDDDDLLPLLVL